jgi:hypothetical protein
LILLSNFTSDVFCQFLVPFLGLANVCVAEIVELFSLYMLGTSAATHGTMQTKHTTPKMTREKRNGRPRLVVLACCEACATRAAGPKMTLLARRFADGAYVFALI